MGTRSSRRMESSRGKCIDTLGTQALKKGFGSQPSTIHPFTCFLQKVYFHAMKLSIQRAQPDSDTTNYKFSYDTQKYISRRKRC